MKDELDAIVIGGGPIGSFAALKMSMQGAKVGVYEEHPEIGSPCHCPGHLGIRSLRNLGLYPLPKKIVENVFSCAKVYSPLGFKVSFQLTKPVTCTVNRTAFDRHIASEAEAQGTHYFLKSTVQSLLIKDGFVKGVSAKTDNNAEERIGAKIVVDAEGISSRILRQTGLPTLNAERLVYGVEAELENVRNVDPNTVEVFLGKTYAPGFYAWVIPKRDGTAKVGLATKTGNPRAFLNRLIHKHPVASKQLTSAKITKIKFHPISLGGPISKTYANGFLAAGDVASHVKPTTGGGVVFGLSCADIAARVAVEAIRMNDFSSAFLQKYQEACQELIGFDFSVMTRIRRLIDSLSDEKLDATLRFCHRIGLNKAFQNVEDIDFQGQALLKIIKKPSVIATLAYFIMLFLTANH